MTTRAEHQWWQREVESAQATRQPAIVFSHASAANDADAVVAHISLADAVHAPDFRVPAPPLAVTRALGALTAKAKASAVAAHLENDPILAGAVERLLRSPSYYCEGESLAALVDGAGRRASHAILEAALSVAVFKAPGFTDLIVRARAHASAVAHTSVAVAVVAGMSPGDVELAFLLGLFHDAGIGAALAHVARHPGNFGRPRASVLAAMIGAVHEEAGERVAASWQLPQRVRSLVKHHHKLDQLSRDPLLAVLLVAEHAANEQGFAVDLNGAAAAMAPHDSYDAPLVHGPEAGLGALALHRAHRQLGRDMDAALRAVRSSQ